MFNILWISNLALLFFVDESEASAGQVAINVTNNGSNGTVHWDYHHFELWPLVNPICETGRRQSPINIDFSNAVPDEELAVDRLLFDRYHGYINGDFFNNGHTIQFTIDQKLPIDKRPRIHGGGLGAEGYIFEQFHLHWGFSTVGQYLHRGSEHAFNDDFEPAEVHFVHFNAKYNSFADAVQYDDGLAVIGFLFEVVNDSRPIETDYEPEASHVHEISEEGVKEHATFNFATLVPEIAQNGSGLWFRYDGSLTTPPCLEIVTWTLFDYRIPIHVKTLDELREATTDEEDEQTHEHHTVHITNNYRPLQPLYDRTVRMNWHPNVEQQHRQLPVAISEAMRKNEAMGGAAMCSCVLLTAACFTTTLLNHNNC